METNNIVELYKNLVLNLNLMTDYASILVT